MLDRAAAAAAPGPVPAPGRDRRRACEAARPEDTDWRQIARLYAELARLKPSPVVELNRAVAVAMANGPGEGLALVDEIDGLDAYHLFHSARADLLRRLDRSTRRAPLTQRL